MKHIIQFILWKIKSKDFLILVVSSLAMYLGWQYRASAREAIYKSYKQGPLKKGF